MRLPPRLVGSIVNRTLGAVVLATLGSLAVVAGGRDDAATSWPQFRGPDNRGVADGYPLPVRWDVAGGEGVAWRTPIPGLGLSVPAVWGRRVFVTTAVGGSDELKVGLYGDIDPVVDDAVHRFIVIALDARNGRVLWSRVAHEGVPAVKRHTKASHANSSVATDGTHVAAMFGSEGLYVYDVKGTLLWSRSLGLLDAGFYSVPDAQWGYASSPVIHDGRLIVLADVQRDSFVAAFDVATGEPLWRTARHDVPTWGTPTVHVADGRAQVIVNGWKETAGYDLADGRRLWHMHGTGDIPVPTPYVAHGLIFLTSAHGGGIPVYAVRPSAVGEITLADGATSNEHIAWSDPRGGSYIPTTVVYGDLLYVLRDNGVLSCRDARTGELHYKERVGVGSGFTASLVAGDGKVYVTAETGEVVVVAAGPTFEILATNEMDEVALTAPAISKGRLFIRTRGHLTAVGERRRRSKRR